MKYKLLYLFISLFTSISGEAQNTFINIDVGISQLTSTEKNTYGKGVTWNIGAGLESKNIGLGYILKIGYAFNKSYFIPTKEFFPINMVRFNVAPRYLFPSNYSIYGGVSVGFITSRDIILKYSSYGFRFDKIDYSVTAGVNKKFKSTSEIDTYFDLGIIGSLDQLDNEGARRGDNLKLFSLIFGLKFVFK